MITSARTGDCDFERRASGWPRKSMSSDARTSALNCWRSIFILARTSLAQRFLQSIGLLVDVARAGDLAKHFFERAGLRAHLGHRTVGNHVAFVDDDHAIADALDDLENVRAIENRLAGRRQ